MDDIANYASLINTIFGPGAASPKGAPGTSNPVIGGLNFTGASFRQFSAAFTKRLQRISRLYQPGSAEWDFLLEQANLISSPSNWEGAYSELAAYDFFHHAFRHKSSSPWQMKFNQDIPNTDTFAAALGGTGNANLDLHFPWSDIYADIKSLKDIVEELLESVALRAAQRKGIKGLVAIPEYPAGIDYTEIQNRFQDLVKEVEQILDITKKPRGMSSQIVKELGYKFGWDPGVTVATRQIEPYAAAGKYHQLVFSYANKFTLNKPFLLVMVGFDWFHGGITSFNNSDITFYRAFARRVFMQYDGSPQLFSQVASRFRGPETVDQVTKKISGILFLRDQSILSDSPDSPNVDGYLYLNPRADHMLQSTVFYHYLLEHALKENDAFTGDSY